MGLIYHAFCTVTGKAYVGQTWGTAIDRWRAHRHDVGCVKLYRAIKKYGDARFILSVLTQGLETQADMDAAEVYWIQKFDCVANGYNIRHGGSHGKHSIESKARMSSASLGKPKSRSHCASISAAMSGRRAPWAHRKHSAEENQRVSAAKTGKKASAEHVASMRASRPGRKIVDQHGRVFWSVAEAAAAIGADRASVRRVAQGKQHSSLGFVFRYVE